MNVLFLYMYMYLPSADDQEDDDDQDDKEKHHSTGSCSSYSPGIVGVVGRRRSYGYRNMLLSE